MQFNNTLSVSLAFLIGAVVNYICCITFVFNTYSRHRRYTEFFYFILTALLGLVATLALVTWFITLFYWPVLLSKLCAAAIILLANFAIRRTYVFGTKTYTQEI